MVQSLREAMEGERIASLGESQTNDFGVACRVVSNAIISMYGWHYYSEIGCNHRVVWWVGIKSTFRYKTLNL